MKKIIIVGSFQKNNKKNKIFGGISSSCEILMNSSFSNQFIIIPLDSTQVSTPPPGVLIRTFFAAQRIIIFVGKLFYFRPHAVLVFTADGASFVEKSLMLILSRLTRARSFVFPRAGNLIGQTERSRLMCMTVERLLRNTDVFLSQGPSWSSFAIDKMGFDKDHVHLLPNWTATKQHLDIGSKHDVTATDNAPNILFVGWLEESKGVLDLMLALLSLYKKGHNFKMTFVGGGGAEEALKRFVQENNLNEVVNFEGWVERESLFKFFSGNDIFVLPSWSEGLPNSMIEAMACGLAVIVTSVGMVPDFVTNNRHALVVPPKNSQSLEGALAKLILDINLRKKIAGNGYNLAKNEFSVDLVLNRMVHVINSEINNDLDLTV